MKLKFTLTALAASALAGNAATTTWGGTTTTDVDNWTTNSATFVQGTSTGFAANWENVVTNNASIDSANNEFDLSFEATTNYTIGHIFMLNNTFDLATTAGGLETLTMTADFEATGFANWSPVVAITDGGTSTYYRWNHSGNQWSGNGALDFSLGNFDLSQNGNATNTTTVIWGELVNTAGTFGATRINANNPNLQATSGQFQVGFIQWGASTGGSVAATDFSNSIDSFEVEIGYTEAIPEPSSALLLGLAGLGFLRRRR